MRFTPIKRVVPPYIPNPTNKSSGINIYVKPYKYTATKYISNIYESLKSVHIKYEVLVTII